MLCTVGVAVTEDHSPGTIGVDVGGAVHKERSDAVATDIGDGISGRSHHIHQTCHGATLVRWHTGDNFRQGNMEGEGPSLCVTGTVGVRIAVNDVSLTSVKTSAVNGNITSCERVAAGIGNHRHGDAVGGDSGHAMDRGFTVSSSDREVLWNDVEGVGPGVCGVVDGVRIGENRVTASATADERGAREDERAANATYANSRCCGSMDITDAVDSGVGIGYRSESYGFDSVDELPWILTTCTVGVGVVVGDGAVSVGGDIDDRVAGTGDSVHFPATGVGNGTGSGF